MNTDRHLNVVTKAAFSILSDEFNRETGIFAHSNPSAYHHIYEWEAIGVPGMELWSNRLSGRGGERRVSWNWRASKTTVPTLTDATGNNRWPQVEGFNPEELRRIHVFVWKAPVMEYGLQVTVRPKLGKVLVFPDKEILSGVGTGSHEPTQITFTSRPVTTTPGRQVQGNFTAWFINWWGGGRADSILESSFKRKRDLLFKKHFSEKIFASKNKNFKLTPDAAAAAEGRRIAQLITGELERDYISMARARRRLTG